MEAKLKYADQACFDLACELRGLMARVMASSKRDTLSLAQKVALKDVAHVLDAQSRKLLAITEA